MVENANIPAPEQEYQFPQGEEAEAGQVESQTAPIETDRGAQESSPGKQAPQVTQAIQPPVQISVIPVAADEPSGATSPADDPIAKDLDAKEGDLIEKQWVERAKSIIAQTEDDPHKQKHEVSKIKAAYIQKRFNKVIKTDEAAA